MGMGVGTEAGLGAGAEARQQTPGMRPRDTSKATPLTAATRKSRAERDLVSRCARAGRSVCLAGTV